MLYMDSDESVLFDGIINCLILIPSENSPLNMHAAKAEVFLNHFCELAEKKTQRTELKSSTDQLTS